MTEVFPDEDYRFHLRFQRGSFAEFFRPTAEGGKLLAERRRWLRTAPQTYAALLPDGIPLLEETIELGLAEHVLPDEFRSGQSGIQHPTFDTRDHSTTPSLHHTTLLDLGAAWEPDFLVLKPNSAGRIVLVAACVCF